MQNDISRSQHVKDWRKRTKQRIINAFDGKCGICGYCKCQEALDLHHLIPKEKEFSLRKMVANSRNWLLIVEELKKCVLLCANCHREFHADLIVIPENIIKFNEEYTDYKNIERLDKDSSLVNLCPICNKEKPYWHKTCSTFCALKLRGKYDWNAFDLKDLYENRKMNFTEIAVLVGCNGVSVKKRLVKEGIIVKDSKKIINWPSNQELEILVTQKSLVKIAEQIGCSEAGLRKHLRRNNIKWIYKGCWQKRNFK